MKAEVEIVKAGSQNHVDKFDDFKSLDDMTSYATMLIASGILPTTFKTPESVIAVVLQGRELGLKPMIALQNIVFISGKPTLGVNIISALLKKGGVETQTIKDNEPIKDSTGKVIDYITTIRFFRYSTVLGKVLEEDCSFRWSDAGAAGLTVRDQWKKWLSQMMYARCLSKGGRRVGNDILSGLYETTEMADSMNANYTFNEEGEVTILS